MRLNIGGLPCLREPTATWTKNEKKHNTLNAMHSNATIHLPSRIPVSCDSEVSLSLPFKAAAAAGIASGVSFSAASVDASSRQIKRQAMTALGGLDAWGHRIVRSGAGILYLW